MLRNFCTILLCIVNITLAQTDIQALLNAGGIVTLPPGTYSFSTLYFNTSGTTLVGSKGTVLLVNSQGHWGLDVNAPDCRITGLTIEGNFPNIVDAGSCAIRVRSTGTRCNIDNVTIKNECGNSIRLDGVDNVKITNCTITNSGYNGILVQSNDTKHCNNI